MNDALQVIGAILGGGWKLLSETEIPGVGFSIAALLVGLLMVSFGFRVLSYILGWRFSMDDSMDTADWISSQFRGYGGSKGGELTISDARKNDEI